MRRWLYTVMDCDDKEVYVDVNGDEVDRSDAKEHVASDVDADSESERRANLWEEKNNALVLKVTRHSQGKYENQNT